MTTLHIIIAVLMALLIGMIVGAALSSASWNEKIKKLSNSTTFPARSMEGFSIMPRLNEEYIVIDARTAGAVSDTMKSAQDAQRALMAENESLVTQNLELENKLLKKEEAEGLVVGSTEQAPITTKHIKDEIVKPMVEDIIWLLGYINRLKQNSEYPNDTKALRAVQENLTTTKGVWRV